MKPCIIALHGLPGSGKDTIGTLLSSALAAHTFSFAYGVYRATAAALDVPVAHLRDRESKTHPRSIFANANVQLPGYRAFLTQDLGQDLYTPRTSRYHLQKFGTDYMVALGTPARWAGEVSRQIEALPAEAHAIVTDLRGYTDEREIRALRAVAASTGRALRVVKLLREGCQPSSHQSDAPLPDYYIDFTVANEEGHPWTAASAILEFMQASTSDTDGGVNG
jgi:hypothetical protein